MKKMVLVLLSGAILTSCGNNVEVKETETKEHTLYENIEVEEIEVETIDIENVGDGIDDDVDEYGNCILSDNDSEYVTEYIPKCAMTRSQWDRYIFGWTSNDEFDAFAKENLIDCGTVIVYDDNVIPEGYRVLVDRVDRNMVYFVEDQHDDVNILVVFSDNDASKNGFDRADELLGWTDEN